MVSKYIFCFVFFLAGLFFAQSAFASKDSTDFSLPTSTGKTWRLEDQKGKVVVVDFWAIWCVSCRKVFPVLNELKKTYPKKQISIVGISLDKKKTKVVTAFAKKAGIEYTVLLDPQGKTAELFKIEALPTLLVFSPEGKIVKRKQGFSPGEKEELSKAISSLL